MGLYGKKKYGKTADEWFNLGLEAQDLDKKVKYYTKALEIDPHNALAWYNKGYALGQLGRYEAAIHCYDKALEIDPKDALAWTNKGCGLHNLGRHEDAINCFDKALEIDPKDALAWNNKGTALSQLRRYEAGIKCYDKALEIDPKNALAWNNKGFTLANLGRYEDAIDYYDKALEIDPNHELARNNKAVAEQKIKGGKCFIATAVYGDADVPEVQLLRKFRDQFLLPSLLGRLFVSAYYFISPKMITLLRGNKAKKVVKFLVIKPAIWIANKKVLSSSECKEGGQSMIAKHKVPKQP